MKGRTYYLTLVASALIAALVAHLVSAWVLEPVGVSAEGEVWRRLLVAFVAGATPPFVAIALHPYRKGNR